MMPVNVGRATLRQTASSAALLGEVLGRWMENDAVRGAEVRFVRGW